MMHLTNSCPWLPLSYDKVVLSVAFSSSSPRLETRYTSSEGNFTRSEVFKVLAEDRTVFQWSILVDWDLQKRRPFVVIDPIDPTGLLYLNHAEYLSQSKVCASNDLPLVVVARPGSRRPDVMTESPDPSQNSPWGIKIDREWGRDSRLTWKTFLKLRASVARIANRKTNSAMVTETKESLVRSVLVWTRTLAHYAELRNPETYGRHMIPLISHLQHLLTNNGRMAVVQHLKLSLFALYSFISGNPLKSTMPLGWGIRLRTCGLPRCWSIDLVKQIRRGDIQSIRLMASLLNLYRAMEAPHPDFSVASIVKPHPDFSENKDFAEFQEFCQEVFPTLLRWEMKQAGVKDPSLEFKYQSAKGLIIFSAGANVSGPAMGSLILDAQAWAQQPKNHAKEWFDLHKDHYMSKLITELAQEAHSPIVTRPVVFKANHYGLPKKASVLSLVRFEPALAVDPKVLIRKEVWTQLWEDDKVAILRKFGFPLAGVRDSKELLMPTMQKLEGPTSFARTFMASRQSHIKNEVLRSGSEDAFAKRMLGRLHAIDEPAGKVRVVAICDYFSQVALKPIHDHLFSLLRNIRNDATFDQVGVTERYFNKGLTPHWSFDLKSATDTIPLLLYREVLKALLIAKGDTPKKTEERVELWMKIATDRDFLTPDGMDTVRYGTGQPMGVLSSWASMAIVHHALVQYAAWKQGASKHTWYQNYLVLGDDIDIAVSKSVADGYKAACDAFQIVIGLVKSLHSKKNCFEFANQRFCPEGNISPLSFKEELQAQTWTTRLEYARRILTRFGTTLKDEASALMLKASTSAQWKVVLPERSGDRPSMISNLIRFNLLTPFSGGARLDDILNWIDPILTSEDRRRVKSLRASPEAVRDLRTILAKALLDELKLLVQSQLKRIPTPYSVKTLKKSDRRSDLLVKMGKEVPLGGLNPRFDILKMMSRKESLLEGGIELSVLRDATKHPGAEVGILYVMHCVAEHNSKIANKLELIKNKLQNLAIPSEGKALHEIMKSVVADLPKRLGIDSIKVATPEQIDDPLELLLELWDELISVPQPLTPDFNVSLSSWMKGEEVQTVLSRLFSFDKKRNMITYRDRVINESIRSPMTAISLSLIKALGVTIPPLPNTVRKTGGPWLQNLKSALAEFKKSRDARIEELRKVSLSEPFLDPILGLTSRDVSGTIGEVEAKPQFSYGGW